MLIHQKVDGCHEISSRDDLLIHTKKRIMLRGKLTVKAFCTCRIEVPVDRSQRQRLLSSLPVNNDLLHGVKQTECTALE
mgnify:CR=1 FL=1